MIKIGKKIVKYRVQIMILAVLLLIPSVIGIINTRVNYDILNYLPNDMETVKGQKILLDQFGTGAFSLVMVDGMENKQVSELKEKIEGVDDVASVIWYDSIADISIPMEILPDSVYEAFNSEDTTMMAVFFDSSVSSDETLNAITQIRSITDKKCFVSGMSAFVTDLKIIAEEEEPIYVTIAVILCCIVLAIFMDSFLIPIVFMISIGIAILYNLGSNYMFGEISYITKALSAVLQLGVTMDYSIFLWHSYEEQKKRYEGDKERAMAHAISGTLTSVAGSSVTTIAGFLALCFMSFTLGKDLGLVMAKGVLFGLIGCVTILPSMILVFDKPLEKTMHKSIMPDMSKISELIISKRWLIIIIFVIIFIPAIYGFNNTKVYYKLDDGVPKDLDCIVANSMLKNKFNMNATHMLLVDVNMSSKDTKSLINEVNKIDGVKLTLGLEAILGASVPKEVIPESITEVLESDEYKLLLISSEYEVASNEVNEQITKINNVVQQYDPNGMLIGEAPCTKDLITITDKDFKVVDILSIAAIFIIIFFVLKSVSLPFILVAVIEFAVFINLGIPCYTGSQLPFIASICISTIQLGATVDYAILMSTRYKKERSRGREKKEAVTIALKTSIPSIVVSALGFFAATFGVGIYSDIDIISSLCSLMARGAIISMCSVILVLPSLLIVFDGIICRTTISMNKNN